MRKAATSTMANEWTADEVQSFFLSHPVLKDHSNHFVGLSGEEIKEFLKSDQFRLTGLPPKVQFLVAQKFSLPRATVSPSPAPAPAPYPSPAMSHVGNVISLVPAPQTNSSYTDDDFIDITNDGDGESFDDIYYQQEPYRPSATTNNWSAIRAPQEPDRPSATTNNSSTFRNHQAYERVKRRKLNDAAAQDNGPQQSGSGLIYIHTPLDCEIFDRDLFDKLYCKGLPNGKQGDLFQGPWTMVVAAVLSVSNKNDMELSGSVGSIQQHVHKYDRKTFRCKSDVEYSNRGKNSIRLSATRNCSFFLGFTLVKSGDHAGYYRLTRDANFNHTCGLRQVRNSSRAPSMNVVIRNSQALQSQVIRNDTHKHHGIATDLYERMRREDSVFVSRKVLYKFTQNMGGSEVENHFQSFTFLPSLLANWKETDPGGIYHIDTASTDELKQQLQKERTRLHKEQNQATNRGHEEDNGRLDFLHELSTFDEHYNGILSTSRVFKRLLVMPSWTQHFFQHGRKIGTVDGCHCKALFKGVILSFVAKSASNRPIAIAFAYVSIENHDNWDYFITGLASLLANIQVILSDKDKGLQSVNLVNTTVTALNNSNAGIHLTANDINIIHGHCALHLAKNVGVTSKEGKAAVCNYAKAPCVGLQNYYYERMLTHEAVGEKRAQQLLDRRGEFTFLGLHEKFGLTRIFNETSTNAVENINGSFLKAIRFLDVCSMVNTWLLDSANVFSKELQEATLTLRSFNHYIATNTIGRKYNAYDSFVDDTMSKECMAMGKNLYQTKFDIKFVTYDATTGKATFNVLPRKNRNHFTNVTIRFRDVFEVQNDDPQFIATATGNQLYDNISRVLDITHILECPCNGNFVHGQPCMHARVLLYKLPDLSKTHNLPYELIKHFLYHPRWYDRIYDPITRYSQFNVATHVISHFDPNLVDAHQLLPPIVKRNKGRPRKERISRPISQKKTVDGKKMWESKHEILQKCGANDADLGALNVKQTSRSVSQCPCCGNEHRLIQCETPSLTFILKSHGKILQRFKGLSSIPEKFISSALCENMCENVSDWTLIRNKQREERGDDSTWNVEAKETEIADESLRNLRWNIRQRTASQDEAPKDGDDAAGAPHPTASQDEAPMGESTSPTSERKELEHVDGICYFCSTNTMHHCSGCKISLCNPCADYPEDPDTGSFCPQCKP